MPELASILKRIIKLIVMGCGLPLFCYLLLTNNSEATARNPTITCIYFKVTKSERTILGLKESVFFFCSLYWNHFSERAQGAG